MRSPSRAPGQQVRAVAHRLHAAGDDDVDVAERDALRGEHHGLEAGAAHLVDRQRRHAGIETAAERRLPRGRLAEPGADDVAEDALVDGAGIDAGARDRLAHGHRAEVGRAEVLQRAEELAGRRSNGADDDGFAHVDRQPRDGGTTFDARRCSGTTSMAIRRTTSRPTRSATRRAISGRARDELLAPRFRSRHARGACRSRDQLTVAARASVGPAAIVHANDDLGFGRRLRVEHRLERTDGGLIETLHGNSMIRASEDSRFEIDDPLMIADR